MLYVRHLLKTTDGTATGTAQILVNGEGQNCIIIIAGANGQLTPADVRAAEDVIAQAAVLMVRACRLVCSCSLCKRRSTHTHDYIGPNGSARRDKLGGSPSR